MSNRKLKIENVKYMKVCRGSLATAAGGGKREQSAV